MSPVRSACAGCAVFAALATLIHVAGTNFGFAIYTSLVAAGFTAAACYRREVRS